MSPEQDRATALAPEPLARLLARWRDGVGPARAATAEPSPDGAAMRERMARARRWWRRSSAVAGGAEGADLLRAEVGETGARWLGELAAATDAPVGWAIGRAAYDELVKTALPPRHELATLLELAGTPTGDDRCARAHDRLLHEPLPEPLRLGVIALCRDHGEALAAGLMVVSCLVGPSVGGGELDLGTLLPPLGPVHTAAELLGAVRARYAASVLATVVAHAARAGAVDLSLALLLLPAATTERVRARAPTTKHPTTAAAPEGGRTTARRGSIAPPDRVAEPVSGPRLLDGVTPADSSTLLCSSALLPLISRILRDLARRHGLDLSDAAAIVALRGAELTIDPRSVAECLRGVPRPLAELVLVGFGIPDLRGPSLPPSRWERARSLRVALAAARGVTQATSLTLELVEPELTAAEPALTERMDALAEIDLGLLPTDALGTSLEHAFEVLEEALSLWLRARAAELVLQAAMAKVVRARVPDSPILAGVLMAELGKASLQSELADELGEAAALVAVDQASARALHEGVRTLEELPAGATRGSLVEIVAGFGDWCARPWELSVARWSENPGELFALVRAAAASSAIASSSTAAPSPRQRRANALAAGRDELARLEPALSTVERFVVRALLGRLDDLAVRRRSKDRAVLRALALARRVAVEVDRRLARFGGRAEPGGVFLSALEPLRHALETDTQELGRLIQMRQAEQRLVRERASAPHVAPDSRTEPGTRAGVGSSPGMAVGRACVATDAEPPAFEPGGVLVVYHAAETWGGLMRQASAVVSEHDAPLSGPARLCRALGVPMVCGVPGVTSWLRSGDRVRVDGRRGSVERLGP